jgi:hypothetical protein
MKAKVKPLVVTMQKNEGEMIFAWAKYHTALFGIDCVTIFDNGSTCQTTIKILDELKAIGINVISGFDRPIDFEMKGDVLGNYFKYRKGEFNLFIPLDCDEFLAVSNKHGEFSCEPGHVKNELSKYIFSDAPLMIKGSFYNVPYSTSKFFFFPEEKVFFSSQSFQSVDMGFHYGKTLNLSDNIFTEIVHIHLCHKPLWKVQNDAIDKLKLRLSPGQKIDNYTGPGQHLAKYFTINELEYENSYGSGIQILNFLEKTESLDIDFNFFTSKTAKITKIEHSNKLDIDCRDIVVSYALKLSLPVLDAYSKGLLPKSLPKFRAKGKEEYFFDVAALECIGRLFCGIAPWLQLNDDESQDCLNKLLTGLELDATASQTQLQWGKWQQNLVDASYFAIGLMNAPIVFNNLSLKAKNFIRDGLLAALTKEAFYNNWILMPAVINLCLDKYWNICNIDLVINSIKTVDSWYVGDGFYRDGYFFAFDYYNSYVFHPFLMEINKNISSHSLHRETLSRINTKNLLARSQRYAVILEKLADKDGRLPVVGRSATYRTGAFYLISNLALNKMLPPSLSENKIRCLLLASIDSLLGQQSCYDVNNFLKPGYNSFQPLLSEDYITSGSLYMAALIFNILGLEKNDTFWSGDDELWVSQAFSTRVGELIPNDISLERSNGYKQTSIFI